MDKINVHTERIIAVHLDRTFASSHWPCPLCGGVMEKELEIYPVVAAGRISNGPFSEAICDECLLAGPTGIRERILAHAEALERKAGNLRDLSGVRFVMPSVEALNEARTAYGEAFAAQIEADDGPLDIPFAAHEACVFTHPHEGPHRTASDMHILEMQETYGTRSPVCNWCGEPVWMSLQGFFSGGSWTTNPDNEGPNFGCKELDVQAEQCAKSLSGRHEVQTE